MEKALIVGGWTVVVLGVVLLGFGFFQDVTVTTGGYYDPYLQRSDPPSQVVNYSLMFGALRMILAGGFLTLAGLVSVIAGEVIGRLQAPAAPGLPPASEPLTAPAVGAATEAPVPSRVSETDHRAMIMVGFMVILAVISIAAVVVGQRDQTRPVRAYSSHGDAAATASAAAEEAAEAARLAAAEAADAGY